MTLKGESDQQQMALLTDHMLQRYWKRLCLVRWAAAPCVWTLCWLTYLLTY